MAITVAIAGFSGKLASLIATHLLKSHPDIKIHGIARALDKVDHSILASPNVTAYQASATDTNALRRALQGASVAICCYLGEDTLMVDCQKTLIDACIAEGVGRYIASDWALDFRGLEMGQHPIKDPMKHIQAYLEEKERETGGAIKGVHVLVGAFMTIFLGPWNPSFRPQDGVYQYWGTGDELLDMTTYEDSAAFTAEVAADPTAVGFLNLLGDRKSVRQIVAAYEKAYGDKLELQCLGTLDDLKKTMMPIFEADRADRDKWRGMFYLYYMWNGQTSLGQLDNSRYPNVMPKTIEDFFAGQSKEALMAM